MLVVVTVQSISAGATRVTFDSSERDGQPLKRLLEAAWELSERHLGGSIAGRFWLIP